MTKSLRKAATPCGSLYHEMWNDGSRDFKAVIRRMLRLGYKIKIIPIEHDFQQNQYLGNKSLIV